MSTYTTQVRYICESKSGFTPEQLLNKSIDEIISASRNNVFNFDFPVYDESFRSVLESTILLHFYTREIGAETVGLWQHYLCRKLREIMPRYNKLFLSSLLQFDPFHDVDYTRTHEGESTGDKTGTHSNTIGTTGQTTESRTGTEAETTSGETETENSDSRTENTTTSGEKTGSRSGSKTTHDTHSKDNTHRDYYSDTPMTRVEGVNGTPVTTNSGTETLGYNYYLTNYRRIVDEETGENNGSESQTETTGEETEGTSRTTSSGTANGSGTTSGERNLSTTDSGQTNTTTNTSDTGRNTEEFTNTDDYVDHIVGKMGTASYSSMLTEYRETIINYMELLLNELEPLFMNIW